MTPAVGAAAAFLGMFGPPAQALDNNVLDRRDLTSLGMGAVAGCRAWMAPCSVDLDRVEDRNGSFA
jgi:hypothetical protein